mgnify:CR=1 FL=1
MFKSKNSKLVALCSLIVLVFVVTGCSDSSSNAIKNEEAPTGTTLKGKVVAPNGTTIAAANLSLGQELASNGKAVAGADLYAVDIDTDQKVGTAKVTTGEDGSYKITGISKGTNVKIVAEKGDVKLTALVPDAGNSDVGDPNGDNDPTTVEVNGITTVATKFYEENKSEKEDIKDHMTDVMNQIINDNELKNKINTLNLGENIKIDEIISGTKLEGAKSRRKKLEELFRKLEKVSEINKNNNEDDEVSLKDYIKGIIPAEESNLKFRHIGDNDFGQTLLETRKQYIELAPDYNQIELKEYDFNAYDKTGDGAANKIVADIKIYLDYEDDGEHSTGTINKRIVLEKDDTTNEWYITRLPELEISDDDEVENDGKHESDNYKIEGLDGWFEAELTAEDRDDFERAITIKGMPEGDEVNEFYDESTTEEEKMDMLGLVEARAFTPPVANMNQDRKAEVESFLLYNNSYFNKPQEYFTIMVEDLDSYTIEDYVGTIKSKLENGISYRIGSNSFSGDINNITVNKMDFKIDGQDAYQIVYTETFTPNNYTWDEDYYTGQITAKVMKILTIGPNGKGYNFTFRAIQENPIDTEVKFYNTYEDTDYKDKILDSLKDNFKFN